MFVVSAGLEESEAVQVPDGLDYGLPCVFAGCSGFFHPAGGATGIVLCSPWGYEDLAMRKSWRLLAEAVAKAGYPCLRFDYPGTGNSLGAATDPSSVDAWIAAIGAAADLVRRTSGVKRFVFIGQSLGAALAVEAARRRGDVVGLHLIAPVVKGRAHVRELAATSRMVADKLGIEPDVTDADALSVVGFALAPAMVASLKALDLLKLESLGVEHVVIYDQSDRKAAVEALEQFRRLGADVALEPLAPYHLMVSDATIIQPLPVEADRLIEIVRARHPLARPAGDPVLPPLAGVMLGPTFREEPIRFGPQQALFGVLCRRIGARADQPAVILLNRGLNPHVGWRRISVDHARRLADAGITSLRIDVSGLGESRDEPGRPQNLIYSDLLVPDIRAAVDALVARGHSRIVLAGVCSGAYMALAAAHADPRVTDVVAVNAQRFLWNPKESFEDVIRFGLRSIDDYVGDLKSGGALRKLLRSRRRILPAMAFLARRYAKHAMARVPLHLRSRLMRDSMEARVAQFFFDLEAQRTRIALVFSAGDPGLVELRNYFGPDGRDMPHANVTISIVPDADHNLTTNAACDRLLAHILDAVGAGPSAEPPRQAPRPAPASSRRAAYST